MTRAEKESVAPIAYDVQRAAQACSMSPSTIQAAIRAGQLKASGRPSENGRIYKYWIRPADLEAWFDSMETA